MQGKKTLSLCVDALEKIKNIVPQSTLDKENRLQNVQGVYQLRNKDQLEGKKILLISLSNVDFPAPLAPTNP